MEHIIIFTALPYYEEVIDRIYDTSPESGVVNVDLDTIESQLTKLSTRPFYSNFYWVIVECDTRLWILKHIKPLMENPWVRFCFLCTDKKSYTRLRDFMIEKQYPFQRFNSYKVTFFAKQKFVRRAFARACPEEPPLSPKLVSFIAKRLRGYENDLELIMQGLLSSGKKVTMVNMGKALPEKNFVSTSNFMLTLFAGEYQEHTYENVTELVARYKNYSSPLLKAAEKFFSQWEKLYQEFAEGNLNERNYTVWLADNGKDYEISSVFHARQWIHVFRVFSYELMLSFCMKFREDRKRGFFAGYSNLIYIVSIVGEMGEQARLQQQVGRRYNRYDR